MFIRKKAINLVGPRDADIIYTGDLDYSFKIVSKGAIIHIPEFLATHRIHSQSLSNQAQGAKMADEVAKLVETYIDYPILDIRPRKRKKIMAKWYFSCIFFTGSNYRKGGKFFIKSIQQSPLTVMTEIIKKVIRFLMNRSKKMYYLSATLRLP